MVAVDQTSVVTVVGVDDLGEATAGTSTTRNQHRTGASTCRSAGSPLLILVSRIPIANGPEPAGLSLPCPSLPPSYY